MKSFSFQTNTLFCYAAETKNDIFRLSLKCGYVHQTIGNHGNRFQIVTLKFLSISRHRVKLNYCKAFISSHLRQPRFKSDAQQQFNNLSGFEPSTFRLGVTKPFRSFSFFYNDGGMMMKI
jgi:hypothetical protein